MLDVKKLLDESNMIWVDYAKGESYQIRFITDERVRLEFSREKKLEKETKIEADSNDLMIKIACLAVNDWKGITANKEPYPCTEENKKIIFSKFNNRVLFIWARCKEESLFLGEELEEDLKN